MTDRKAIVTDFDRRQREIEERREKLQAEFDEISPAILAFREAERRMSQIQEQLRQFQHVAADLRGRFSEDLRRAVPEGMAAVMHQARQEVDRNRRLPAASVDLRRLADLREWLERADAAVIDRDIREGDLVKLMKQGETLLQAESVDALA